MILIQIVPKPGVDAYALLRHKVIHEARTWSWGNKRKTRLRHKNVEAGYIDVATAGGVVVARIHPSAPEELYFLVEKLIGRLVAWFHHDLAAINLQFGADAPPRKARRPARLSHRRTAS
jgi:hypothetical protein